GFLGGLSIVMAGLGIGWVNAAADYSRYLPRSSSPGAVVWWTPFRASVAAGNPQLATSVNPIAVLAKDLPTWFLVPYLLTAVGGLVAGALLDIYSSGLNLLTLGLRIPRYQSAAPAAPLTPAGTFFPLSPRRIFSTPSGVSPLPLGVPPA